MLTEGYFITYKTCTGFSMMFLKNKNSRVKIRPIRPGILERGNLRTFPKSETFLFINKCFEIKFKDAFRNK